MVDDTTRRDALDPDEVDLDDDEDGSRPVIVALNPDSTPDRLSRARLQLQRGDSAAAKADLRWVLDRDPAGVDIERLTELYRSL